MFMYASYCYIDKYDSSGQYKMSLKSVYKHIESEVYFEVRM